MLNYFVTFLLFYISNNNLFYTKKRREFYFSSSYTFTTFLSRFSKSGRANIITAPHPKHLILTAPHPSPLSAYRGFFGCKHFSQANEFLVKNGMKPIDWQIEDI